MKSANPHSGFHKEEIAKTLDTTDPNPTKNQGGNVIVDAVAIAENIIGRADDQGGNGVGAQEELAYTQNATGVMGVCTKGNGDAFESDVHTSLSASGGGQAGQGYPCARIASTVRRLLPIECERLMGFPDNHTKIAWKGKSADECPDSPRYKAAGNSMCVNVMQWIGEQIDRVERKYANEQ
jgi:DNA (cytosine-5)-methyltransferase 1